MIGFRLTKKPHHEDQPSAAWPAKNILDCIQDFYFYFPPANGKESGRHAVDSSSLALDLSSLVYHT